MAVTFALSSRYASEAPLRPLAPQSEWRVPSLLPSTTLRSLVGWFGDEDQQKLKLEVLGCAVAGISFLTCLFGS